MRSLLLALSFISLSCPALAEQEPPRGKTMLVLDASGSMWGQVEGITKIEIARQAVSDMVGDWDDTTDLGLIAYGHNREGDCGDIETVLAPKPLNSENFIARVNAITPKGKTPLTDAVVMAAEALDFSKEQASVILLTDGKETCSVDPCATGAALEARGIDFTVHIIGFDVPEEDVAGLRCLSDATGGLYLDADDAGALNDALAQARDATQTPSEKPEPVCTDGEAMVRVPATALIGGRIAATWAGPGNPLDRFVIRNTNGEAVYTLPVASVTAGDTAQLLAPNAVGIFTLSYESAPGCPVLAETSFEVQTVTASVTAPESVLAGSKFTVQWDGPGAPGDRLKVIDPATDNVLSATPARAAEGGIAEIKAPTDIGPFEIALISQTGAELARTEFTTTGFAASVEIEGGSTVSGRHMNVLWVGPKNKGDRLRVFPRGSDTSLSQRPVGESAKNPIRVRVPKDPGAYSLKLVSSDGKVWAETDFSVVAQ